MWTNKGISQADLQKAAQEYKANIEKAWSGTYEQKGIKFEVSTTVDIKVYGSEQAATDSGAQNVFRVTEAGGHSGTNAASIFGGPDTGEIALDGGTRNSEAAHEFTHMLGVDDRYSGAFLSHTKQTQRAMSATAYDYGWAFGGAINDHREGSRPLEMRGVMPANPSGIWGRGRERSHTSTRVLGAPYNLGFGKDFWR